MNPGKFSASRPSSRQGRERHRLDFLPAAPLVESLRGGVEGGGNLSGLEEDWKNVTPPRSAPSLSSSCPKLQQQQPQNKESCFHGNRPPGA